MNNYKYILHLYRIRKEKDNCYLTITPYGKIIELNEVGYQFLIAAKQFDNIEELINNLSKIYNVDKDEISEDIIEFMEQMLLTGIVEKKIER